MFAQQSFHYKMARESRGLIFGALVQLNFALLNHPEKLLASS
jgi:hypothetical protein